HIDPSPVWVEWGLSLLRLGRYEEAKEKFSSCLHRIDPLTFKRVGVLEPPRSEQPSRRPRGFPTETTRSDSSPPASPTFRNLKEKSMESHSGSSSAQPYSRTRSRRALLVTSLLTAQP